MQVFRSQANPDPMRSLKVAWDNSLAGRDRAGTGVYAARLLEQFANRSDLRLEVLQGWRRNSSATLISRGLGTVRNLLWTHAHLPRIPGHGCGCVARTGIRRTQPSSLPGGSHGPRHYVSALLLPTSRAGG